MQEHEMHKTMYLTNQGWLMDGNRLWYKKGFATTVRVNVTRDDCGEYVPSVHFSLHNAYHAQVSANDSADVL